MRKSNVINRLSLGCVYLLCTASYSPAHGAINLDRLTACDEVADLYKLLRSSSLDESCRAPVGVIENLLIKRTGGAVETFCFLRAAPSPFLSGFSCAKIHTTSGASLMCFRAADVSEIKNYYTAFQSRYASSVERYLKAMSACSASNHDGAHSAAPTEMPLALQYIAQYEFGFIVGLGKSDPPDSSIMHGYASVDTTIGDSAPSALEVIGISIGGQKLIAKDVQQTTAGDWLVSVDTTRDDVEAYNKKLNDMGVAASADIRAYELTTSETSPLTDVEKLEQVADVLQAIELSLTDGGFKKIPGSQIDQYSGKTLDSMFKEMTDRAIPYGGSKFLPKSQNKFEMYTNDRRPACAKKGRGAIAVAIMSQIRGDDDVQGFATIVVMTIGIGECSRTSSESIHIYVGNLFDEAKEQLLETLRGDSLGH